MRCRACGGSSAELFFELPAVPVHCNVLWPTVEAARKARSGALLLALCPDCGLVFNAAFDPSLVGYDASYENSLHHSPRFETYAEALARDLSGRLDLRDRLVVEVGCGKGEFLRRLCEVAGARGLGIDASYDPDIAPESPDDRIAFLREPFTALPAGLVPALIFCRHVLEHLPDPSPFVRRFAEAAGRSGGGRVFLEVPNVLFTLRDLGIWDLIYEHCSYFSAPALARLSEASGLRVERIEPAFGDQFLCAEATTGLTRPTGSSRDFTEALAELSELAARFSAEYRRKSAYWEARLGELHAAGRRVALWGAGSKGVTFVNTVPGGDSVSCLVDLNPRKHGRFVSGTGQPVVAPAALKSTRPDVVLVMNPLYRDEITQLVAQLGLGSAIEAA